jgi:predicted XRE-type DNA-binding protein
MKAAASLIAQADAAAASAPSFSFLDGIQIEQEAGKDGSREFTGERLHRDRPDVYQAIVTAWANGLSQRQIARALRVSANTVAAVIEREPDAVEAQKKRLVTGLRRFAGATVERMLEELDRMPLNALPVALGVTVDKLQLLSGEATARVERVDNRPDKVREYIDSLPVIEGEVIEAAGTGVAGGTDGQKGVASVPVLGLPSVACADLESGASGAVISDDGLTRASSRASGEEFAVRAGGLAVDLGGRGGGGAASVPPLPSMIDTAAQNFGQGAVAPSGAQGSGEVGTASAVLPAADPLCKPEQTSRKRPTKKKGAR